MNVYDSAHALARAIKDSEEYKTYKELKEEVNGNEHLSSMLKDFQEKQMTLQKAQIMGETLDSKAIENAQELYDIMIKDPKMVAYFAAEMKISQILGDVSKIIGEAMDIR